jgi:hypothetical protein
LNTTLKESGNRSGTGFRQGKIRSLLVITEVSLAVVLLIGSALLIRTFIALHGVGPGFDSHNVLTAEMSLNGDRYQKTAGIAQLSRDGRNPAQRHPRCGTLSRRLLAAYLYWRRLRVSDHWASSQEKLLRKQMDEHLAGLLEPVQDSYPARRRFYGER